MSFPRPGLKSAPACLAAILASAVLLGQGAPVTPTVPRAEEVKSLVATLQSSVASPREKVVACHRLAIIGTPESVPALAALLADEKLAHMARHALEPMPHPAAAAALRDALGRLQGSLLIGVINSLGFRRDAPSTAALGRLLSDPSAGIAGAAASALGRIGTVDAARQLQEALARASGALQNVLADACLTCAEALVQSGQPSTAASIYDGLCRPGFPDHIRTAAMGGAITARGDGGIDLLLQQLRGDDRALLAAGWRAARELPGPGVTRSLARELGRLPAEKQTLLIQVLGDRADSAALPVVIEAAERGTPAVRLASLETLPRIDDGKAALPVLLRAVTSGQRAEETEAALQGLRLIKSPEANARMLAVLPTAPPATRAKLIGVLGARRADNARTELLKIAAGPDADLSKAALRALATVAQPSDLPELIRISTSARDDGIRVPADLAIYSVSMKIEPKASRADPVLDVLASAREPSMKTALLRPLGAIIKGAGGNPRALATIQASLQDAASEVRLTALRILSDWPDATPATLLLDLARREKDPAARATALRGGSRMAASVAAKVDPTRLDALAWFTDANRLAQTTEEKLIIVSGLGSVKRIEALRMLQPYLDDPAVQNEAALAVIDIAPALAATPDAAQLRPALDKIIASTKDVDVRRKAAKAAKTLPSRK